MNIVTLLRKTDWLPGDVDHGCGCGYIGLPKGHPWYGKHYNELTEVQVHGGLTWSAAYVGNDEPDGLWWLGFDTNHWGDTAETCGKVFCMQQIESLKQQALKAAGVGSEKKGTWLVYDGNANTCDVCDSEEEAQALADELLAELWSIAQRDGEWPMFDQVYIAKVTHQLQEESVSEDTMEVSFIKV